MLYGHDEGKNIKQLCNGEKDVVCIKMGGTGADTAADATNNLKACGLTGGTTIPSGADLNDYKTVGNYYSAGASISGTISNSPVTTASFMLRVFYGYGNVSIGPIMIQKVINSANGVEFTRAFNGTWSSWKKTLTSGLGIESKTLLWTNASPTSGFAEQTISLDLSGYDFVEILYSWGTNGLKLSTKFEVGASFLLPIVATLSNRTGSREGTSDANGITFKTGGYNTVSSDNHAIPHKIYGIKEV